MESNGEPSAPSFGKMRIHPWLRIIEPPTGGRGKALRKPTHRRLIGETYLAAAQSISVIHPHLIRCGYQNVGYALRPQQGLEDASAIKFGLQKVKVAQYVGVTQHSSGLSPDRSRNNRGPKGYRLRCEPFANPVNQRSGHAAGFSTPYCNTPSTFRAATVNGERRCSRSPCFSSC